MVDDTPCVQQFYETKAAALCSSVLADVSYYDTAHPGPFDSSRRRDAPVQEGVQLNKDSVHPCFLGAP